MKLDAVDRDLVACALRDAADLWDTSARAAAEDTPSCAQWFRDRAKTARVMARAIEQADADADVEVL